MLLAESHSECGEEKGCLPLTRHIAYHTVEKSPKAGTFEWGSLPGAGPLETTQRGVSGSSECDAQNKRSLISRRDSSDP